MKPYFSIIICTLNADRFLNDCLSSVAMQSFQNFEVIIVDAFSTDNTLSIIRKFAARECLCIRLFKQEPHGLIPALNFAMSLARGEYVYFLGADDQIFNSTVLNDVYNYTCDYPSLDWLFGQILLIDEDNLHKGIFPKIWMSLFLTSYILKYLNFVPHQAVFLKKSVLEKYSNFSEDPSITWVSDYDLWLRIATKTNWRFLPKTIAYYRSWSGSNTQSGKYRTLSAIQRSYLQSKFQNTIEQVVSKFINYCLEIYLSVRKA